MPGPGCCVRDGRRASTGIGHVKGVTLDRQHWHVTTVAAANAPGRGLDTAFVPAPHLVTDLGVLFGGDCLAILPLVAEGSVDTVFADPPFNLGKSYGPGCADAMTEADYVAWCQRWLAECIRVLAPGGALFVYNLPRWNIRLGAWLMDRGLTFRHDIAVRVASGFPIPGRLYPAHYSLLYLTKGKPARFRSIRTPVETCRHCDGDVKDYGGYRGKLNPNGINLTDVWDDIPPVRHAKFKADGRSANALSTKLLERVVEISTRRGDLVLDPFGGSGTTYAVCEARGRRWVGMDIDFAPVIARRLRSGTVKGHLNRDWVEPDAPALAAE